MTDIVDGVDREIVFEAESVAELVPVAVIDLDSKVVAVDVSL